METFTFLGCGNNALSMFIEIIVPKYGKDFTLEIVKNIIVDDPTPFLPEEISCTEYWFEDFKYLSGKNYLIGVNKPLAKKAVFTFFLQQATIELSSYKQLIHPSCILSSTTMLGSGVIINPGSITAPFAQLGDLVTVNRNVTIGHHTTIDDFSTLHPGVNIAGHCKIGKCVTIGMGANIVDDITIGDYSVVGAGSLVTKDVPAETVVYGVPAKERS